MSADPNKKSGRSFQCRDVLWETFEQMARELECSVDYLINEAMKQYARQRSYGGASRTPLPQPRTESQQLAAQGQGYGLPPPPAPPPPNMRGGGPVSQRLPAPPMRASSLPMAPPPMRSTQPLNAVPQAQRYTAQPVPPPPARNAPAPPPPRSVPPPLMRPPTNPVQQHGYGNGYGPPPPQPPTHGGMLSVIYQNEKLPVTKDRFVIGRGKQSSDLTLKDPNVSRQHAMVEFQNGVYFMVDMGSTNGVEYNGQRISRKQIGEGDSFRICDHEMRFTYR
jgi:FHA domain